MIGTSVSREAIFCLDPEADYENVYRFDPEEKVAGRCSENRASGCSRPYEGEAQPRAETRRKGLFRMDTIQPWRREEGHHEI